MIALLPMKGHSERVPGKNIRLLNGKPLFFYIADTLRSTDLFEMLAINTDSAEIRRLAAERYGDWAYVIDRPQEICGDYVSMNSIIAHDIALIGGDKDYFQTHSTNPLLSGKTIHDAVERYFAGKFKSEFDSLFSVNELRTRLYDEYLNPVNHNSAVLGRTQDLSVIYEENSSFYIFSGQSFGRNQHRIGVNSRPYVMHRNTIEVIDIDDQTDWSFAELVIKSGCLNE